MIDADFQGPACTDRLLHGAKAARVVRIENNDHFRSRDHAAVALVVKYGHLPVGVEKAVDCRGWTVIDDARVLSCGAEPGGKRNL